MDLEEEIMAYRLGRPLYAGDPNSGACICYVLMKRSSAGGGFLAAIPVAFLTPQERAASGTGAMEYPIGPHTVLTVPASILMEDGSEEPAGDIDIQLVDFNASVANSLADLATVSEALHAEMTGFLDDVDVVPDIQQLFNYAREWLQLQTSARVAFYSAEEMEERVPVTPGGPTGPEEAEVELAAEEDPAPAPGRRQKAVPKAKKVTTAQLAEQIATLMESLPQITDQLMVMQEEQKAIKKHVTEVGEHSRLRPSQLPVSASIQKFTGAIGSPPRIRGAPHLTTPAKLVQKGLDSQLNVQEQAEEDPMTDPLASAILEQSKVMTTLVSHLQQGGDPLLSMQEGASGSSLASRGSVGRERLQRQLANRSGGFCLAVLQNAARRLRPAARLPQTIQEAADQQFSIIPYLERYGGYGAFKELGLIQFAVAHIWDASVHGDLQGVQELTSLLMVGIEQAALDSNRWDFAYKMMLLEEPPAQLWSFRSSGYDPRGRAFAPLAPQTWATTALAYCKETDYIATKRAEVNAIPKKQPQPVQPTPKKKKFPKGRAQPEKEEE